MAFTVYLAADDPITGWQWGIPNPSLRFERKWHRGHVFGGPVATEVEVHGPPNALWEMLEWLRRPVEIYNEESRRVWWGMLNEVRLTFEGLTVGVTLDRMYNRVAVTYSYVSPTGATTRGTTAYAQDDASVGRYGIKELLESLGEANASMALARQAQLLADRAAPRKERSFDGGTAGGLLIGVGWMETLKWRKFNRLEGRIEFEGGQAGGTQAIGWGITSDAGIGFATKSIHDIDGRLKAITEGSKIKVNGSPLNSLVFTVQAGASGEKTVRSSSDFYFEIHDDIKDDSAAPGLGFIKADAFIWVDGTVHNDRYHLIDTAGDGHCTVQYTVTGDVTQEQAALTTITQGHSVQVAEPLVTEIIGENPITLRLYGYELAQGFVANQTFIVDKMALRVGRVGTPVDSFEFSLWSDSGSLPATQMVAGTLAGVDLATSPTWTWFDVANTATIVTSVRYWLKSRRTGALDPLNYYTIELVADSYDLCKAWTSLAWVNQPHGWSMPFKIWGAEDTAGQVKRILSDAGQFFAGIDMQIAASGVAKNQYLNGELTAYDELMKILAAGTSSGKRMLANVTAERIVQIYEEPAQTEDGDRYQLDRSIVMAGGGRRGSGWLPHGEWLVVDGVPSFAATGISPVFVDDAECQDDGDRYSIKSK